MDGKVKLVYTITKTAAEKVLSGELRLNSGGVRFPDGRIFEMARPAIQGLSGNITSPLNLASSLANNVQSGFIQHGVNKANVKLDVSLEKLDQIQAAINGLTNANVLGWVNCTLGMVNCGVAIAGFCLTLDKLNKVAEKVDALIERIDQNKRNEFMERFNRYLLQINTNATMLQQGELTDNHVMSIESHLNEVSAFLQRIIYEFENKQIDGELGCCLIFNVAVAFAQELKGYAARYYYKTGTFPNNYESYMKVLEHISSAEFKDYLKQFLMFECMQIPMEEKYVAFGGAMYGIEYQLANMECSKQLVQQIEEKDYLSGDYLTEKIVNGDYLEIEDTVCIYA